MPWNESNHMDERIKFVARLLDGENMSRMCREFGISRKTGYKIFNRYKDFGLAGLQNQSRRPHRYANKLPFQVEKAIIQIRVPFMPSSIDMAWLNDADPVDTRPVEPI